MRKYVTIALLFTTILTSLARTDNPKREFRGAWMHTVYQEQYAKQSTSENMAYLIDQLDKLKAAGVNVVFFQVRPCADAFYASKYEPWSRYLVPSQTAPIPYWDPLEFMVTEAHKRGIELHAWLNPYRVTTSKNETLPQNHIYHRSPERFIKYEGDGKIYFDPGQPLNRAWIVDVVTDIIEHYDIDGIHFDDYFYPYPAKGKEFGDGESFKKYGKGMKRGDWRRKNVDKLIEEVHYAISVSSRPWIRFGISPFGIWRNVGSDPRGSKTNGLQNYDDLYADVLLWAEKGWIDYLLPQLYWELEHKRASTLTLVEWWAKAVDPKCQLYIGQDVERTMSTPDIAPSGDANQLAHKIRLTRENDRILGNCWWPAYSLTKDSQGSATALANGAQSTPALVPAYTNKSSKKPDGVKKVKLKGSKLSWKCSDPKGKPNDAVKFIVYKFDASSDIDYDDASAIYAITPEKEIMIDGPGIYVVSALDRVNNESNPSGKMVVKQ